MAGLRAARHLTHAYEPCATSLQESSSAHIGPHAGAPIKTTDWRHGHPASESPGSALAQDVERPPGMRVINSSGMIHFVFILLQPLRSGKHAFCLGF
eukprot:7074939-Prymnesium_polylepis.1